MTENSVLLVSGLTAKRILRAAKQILGCDSTWWRMTDVNDAGDITRDSPTHGVQSYLLDGYLIRREGER